MEQTKYHASVIFILIFTCYSCALHRASTLIKRLQCEDVNEISVSYSDSSKYYYYYTQKNKSYYSILLSKSDSSLINSQKEYCKFINILKETKLYKKKQYISALQLQKESITALSIRIERKEDWIIIDAITGGIYIYNNNKGLEIGRNFALIYYASNSYFNPNILNKELILFANKMIVLRNAKVKNDISLSDSLRQPYPLLPISK
jgi:hypothetical protein